MSARKIIKVSANLENLDEVDIELDNGISITLTITGKMSDPLFAQIKELSLPKTDGDRVYWLNGASLTVDEIMAMLRADQCDGAKK